MCTEYLMNLYNPMESLTTDEYNELMAELVTDEDKDEGAE